MSNLVFCLMGPTASGKTALACELVAHFPFEIISVDSAMIYKEMDIGTAKPSLEELAIAPHHLINIVEPCASYSAAQFCHDVHHLVAQIRAKNKIPLLVGGTMMYFNALQQGLAVLPDADEEVRARLEDEALTKGWHYLHEQLQVIDPKAAARIHAHDTQRIQRALEVYHLTGTPMSRLLEEQKYVSPYKFINLALFPTQRSLLHERIAQRFDGMLEQGFLDEVRTLRDKWDLNLSMPAMRCVGYRQALDYLAGTSDYASFREKGIAATRQLAKRQLTWLRHWEKATYFDLQNEPFPAQIIANIREILDNHSY